MFQTNGLTWPVQTPVKLAQSNPQCNRLIQNLVAFQHNALKNIHNIVSDRLQASTSIQQNCCGIDHMDETFGVGRSETEKLKLTILFIVLIFLD